MASDYAAGLVFDQEYLSAWDCGPGLGSCPSPALECVKCCLVKQLVQVLHNHIQNNKGTKMAFFPFQTELLGGFESVLLALSSNMSELEDTVSRISSFKLVKSDS